MAMCVGVVFAGWCWRRSVGGVLAGCWRGVGGEVKIVAQSGVGMPKLKLRHAFRTISPRIQAHKSFCVSSQMLENVRDKTYHADPCRPSQ